MKRSRMHAAGFSLVELVVASGIFLVAVTIAFAGYLHMLRTLSHDDVQNELDVEVQTAMERLKYDLRLTSLDKMFFFPAGSGPFTAVSFPMARDDDGDGAVDMDEDDQIIWDRTIVYHVWGGSPNEFRRTIFDPRDNGLTDLQRQEQIDAVAAGGQGEWAHNGTNATTQTIFANLFNWSILPKGAVLDGYAAETTRAANVMLGSCVLGTGTHDFKFEVIGKNTSSSGFTVGVDSLCVSPSMSAREAEGQLPALEQVGAIADYEYMPGGAWDGNYQLTFPAVQEGNFFTLRIHNDLWRETNFQTAGDSFDNTTVLFDTSLNPADFVVAVQGLETNWSAALQTGEAVGETMPPGLVRGSAVRVLLRGEDMMGGNWITSNGERCKVYFRAGAAQALGLVCAAIGEAASSLTNTMDAAAGTQTALLFGGSAGVTVPAGGTVCSDFVAFPIDREKSYQVTYLVADVGGSGTAWQWTDLINGGLATSFTIPASSTPSAADVLQADWSARGDVAGVGAVVGVAHVYTTYPAAGTYASAIFDTHCETPAYTEINCNATVPSGTDISLKVRTGDAPDLSDAPAWDAIAPIPVFGVIDPGDGRYAQFQATLTADADRLLAPRLRDVMIKWHGPQRMVDVSGTFTKGPDHGVFEITVDGEEILTGVLVDLEIYQDVRGYQGNKRITSQICAEMCPRNSGL